jgi:mannose-1-phosphate guanylyltransferase
MTNSVYGLPLWCILQADGDKAISTNRGAVPVQFCSAKASPPLVQRCIQRALLVTKPRHVVATVAEAHRVWWSDPLWCVAPQRRIVDASTGRLTVTLAVALAVVERAARDAVVVIQPADTFCASDGGFVAGVRRAVRVLDALPGQVVTLTVEAYTSEPGQDYVLPGAEDGLPGKSAVQFVKRPHPLIADRLVENGACLSSGVYVSRLSTLVAILSDLWPDLMVAARALASTTDAEVVTPARMTGSRFSRPWRHTWIQRPLPRLRAVSVDDFGWSSVGTIASELTPSVPKNEISLPERACVDRKL